MMKDCTKLIGVLLMGIILAIFTSGCGEDEKTRTDDDMVKGIHVEEIQVEEIKTETILHENYI